MKNIIVKEETVYHVAFQVGLKSFAVNGRCLQKHRSTCRYQHFTIIDPTTECANNVFEQSEFQNNSISDNKFNYSCNILRDGLMDWCREDAAKENDGDRLVRLWRFDFLRFTLTNHTKNMLFGCTQDAIVNPSMKEETGGIDVVFKINLIWV